MSEDKAYYIASTSKEEMADEVETLFERTQKLNAIIKIEQARAIEAESERDALKKILTFSVNDWTPEQLAEEGLCAKCTRSMSNRDDSTLEPGDICDNCAQELIASLRAKLAALRDEIRKGAG